MKIAILGLGVIGTTYAYTFQKAGHQVEHILRESKRKDAPDSLTVDLLDGAITLKEKLNRILILFKLLIQVQNMISFF